MRARLHPTIARWFRKKFRGGFTAAQRLSVPAILDGRSVLLSSPTGSGKTLAGFLGIIDCLVREREAAASARAFAASGIRAIYVSPLRALTYDIQKNLAGPLAEMGLAEEIRVAQRTGDTPAKERAQLRRRPPHILLTTPESLAVLLAQSVYGPAFAACRFVIVDELHALAENKRGMHLSVSLERLERLRTEHLNAKAQRHKGPQTETKEEGTEKLPTESSDFLRDPSCLCAFALNETACLTRIGLSATVRPLEIAARFLVGEGRECLIAESPEQRRAIIEVYSPLRRHPYPPTGESLTRVTSELARLVRARKSVLIFANARGAAEKFGLRLKEALPELASKIEIHHGSLDRSLRLEVEDRLKAGSLRAVVCSTSLEMGVDIGAVDLVVLIAAPRGVTRALQRIGRSGHSVHAVSHGVLVAINVHDLLECAVTAKLAHARQLDPIRIPENGADVLAQHIVGLAMAEPGIVLDEVFALVRRAYPFRGLSRADFDRVVHYLRGGGRSLEKQYAADFGKVIVDPIHGGLSLPSARVARDYLVNIGTITTEGLTDVFARRRRLGAMDERYVQSLKPGDIFVLGGRVLRFLELDLGGARVEPADGQRPTVPIWRTGFLPLTAGLADEVTRVRGELDEQVQQSAKPNDATDWLVEHLDLSLSNAQAIVTQFALQRSVSAVPRAGLLLAELFREPDLTGATAGLSHYFFHTALGRAANDALSRIVAWRVGRIVRGNALVTVDDYGFLLTLRRAQELPPARWEHECFACPGASEALEAALQESELVRGQFRGVAQTGLMVPRQLPGQSEKRRPRQVRFSAEILFRVLREHEPDHPLLAEAYRQATQIFLDAPRTLDFLEELADPTQGWQWRWVELRAVSPFGFPLFASRLKESLTLDDPEEALERLYQMWTARSGASAGAIAPLS